MAAGDVHLNDIGTIFEATIKDQDKVAINISTATTKELVFKKANGAKLTKTAVFTTDGTNGKIQYVGVAGDVDALGVWELQGHVVTPAGNFLSDIVTFEVFANL